MVFKKYVYIDRLQNVHESSLLTITVKTNKFYMRKVIIK